MRPVSFHLLGGRPVKRQDQNTQQLLDIAVQHHNAGDLAKAEELYQQVLHTTPDHPSALHLLGVIAYQSGNNETAIELISKSVTISPDDAQAHSNLGLVLHSANRLDDAIEHYHKSIVARPGFADPHNNLANTLQELGRFEEAVDHYQKAIQISPNYVDAHFNLGIVVRTLGRLEEAAGHLKTATDLDPDYVEAHYSLGVVSDQLGRLDGAIVHYEKAIQIKPGYADAHYNLGAVFLKLGRLDEAAASYRAAINVKPDFARAHNNLGSAMKKLGHMGEALACFRKAISIDPNFSSAHSNFIYTMSFFTGVDLAGQQEERKRWDKNFTVPAKANIKPFQNSRDPDRRLRIGYVSADFLAHSAATGFAPLIMGYDRDNFDVVCYAGNTISDSFTEKFKASANLWRETTNLSDESMTELIRSDGVDILVDLSGHSTGNRLRVFANKPAPIQVAGGGDLAPGLSTIDYRMITESWTSRAEEFLFPEQPIYLHTYCGLSPPQNLPTIGDAPCVEAGFITFGCFNRIDKVSDETIALWAKILNAVTGSRLALKTSKDPERKTLAGRFQNFGITADRLIFMGKSSQLEHLATFNQIDIALDPFPHGGAITSVETMLMGVPVVGLAKNTTMATRVSRAVCSPVGMSDWIANDEDGYLAIAIDAAQNPQRLVSLRTTLRQNVIDAYSWFGGDVHRAYRDIWKRWCDGLPPAPVDMVK